MSMYVTTNIRLLEEDYLRLKEEAARKRKSLSAVIREKVSKTKKPSRKEYLEKILNLKTDWFTEEDYKDYQKARAELEERAKRYNW